jgi:hypothetical protein
MAEKSQAVSTRREVRCSARGSLAAAFKAMRRAVHTIAGLLSTKTARKRVACEKNHKFELAGFRDGG